MDTAICLHNANVLTGFSVMQNCAVYIKNDKIADVYSEQRFQQKKFSPKVKIINVNGAYIAPGFIDTHIHGIGGFSADDADSKSILKMSDILASYGVTSFIPTIGATPEKQLMPKIKAILKAMGREKGAHILGIHLEGPFLSPERIGGQEQEGISPVDLAYMERIYKTAKGKIINMTVAPELKGMRDLALYCIEKGIILQAGHTNATYDQMIEGMQANIMHVTHMFNAMRPLHHREPGTVGAALTHPEISCEIIGDGVHVNPNLIQLLMKSKPLSQLVLITDSLKYAKAEIPADADFYFDQCFKRKADNVIIGSGITMLDGFKNLVSYGIPPEKAIRMASVNPAKIMQQPHKGLIIPGYDADLVVFNQDFDIIHTIIDGQFLKEK
ncbi:n-acetylglucosamine-6-phosphate deacetylase [Proteobacteria bacterium CAG:495]|nr:n-acetylglucosamine-6-phosphate deacetylase [Proteobacteria bacterium CAG:495]